MDREKNKVSKSSGIVWIWLVFLAFLLLLIKFFFIGTYYINGVDEGEPQRCLLFVSIQSKPKVQGEVILIELTDGELVPAIYIYHSNEKYKVRIGDESKWIKAKTIKGRVIKKIRL